MNNLKRRLERLEHPTGASGPRLQFLLFHAAAKYALDADRCTEILWEAGFGRSEVLYFWNIPDGLNAEQLERFLREHGDDCLIPNPSFATHPMGSTATSRQHRKPRWGAHPPSPDVLSWWKPTDNRSYRGPFEFGAQNTADAAIQAGSGKLYSKTSFSGELFGRNCV